MSESIPPAFLAQIDQMRAQSRDRLAEKVELTRKHIASHDGDTSCAFGCIVLEFTGLRGEGVLTAELLATAIVHLATTETAL